MYKYGTQMYVCVYSVPYAIQERLLDHGDPSSCLFLGHTGRLCFPVSLEVISARVTECLPVIDLQVDVLHAMFVSGNRNFLWAPLPFWLAELNTTSIVTWKPQVEDGLHVLLPRLLHRASAGGRNTLLLYFRGYVALELLVLAARISELIHGIK